MDAFPGLIKYNNENVRKDALFAISSFLTIDNIDVIEYICEKEELWKLVLESSQNENEWSVKNTLIKN